MLCYQIFSNSLVVAKSSGIRTWTISIRMKLNTFCSRYICRWLQQTEPKLYSVDFYVKSDIDKLSCLRHFSCSGAKMNPTIEFKPNGHLLVDDELEIKVNGLNKHQAVSVYAKLSEDGKHYESLGCFNADENGVVNLMGHPSQSGTYTGVSSMGLFWSMIPCPGQMEGIRLMKKNLDTPFKTNISVHNGHCTLNEVRTTMPKVCTTVIERWYKYPDVISYEVNDGNLRGKLFMPSGSGPFPGVIDLFGSVGGLTEFRSALLASRGFASLALPYFLYKDLPKGLNGISLDYFLEAIKWLSSHDKVIPNGVGVIGVSKGGDIALIMGAYSPKIRAVVNINGCTFNATSPLKYSGGDIPEIPIQLNQMEIIDGKVSFKSSLNYTADDITPVWNNNAKVLNILSEDDLCSPKECITLLKEIYPKDKTDNCVVLSYPDAGHLVEPPYTPLCRMSYHKDFNIYFWYGGYPEGHAFAQEDSWRSIQKFFHEELTKVPIVSAKL